jgi:hypothetical protein
MFNLLIVIFSICLALSLTGFVYGSLLGVLALPTLVTKTSHKYGMLVLGLVVPFFTLFACLFNYKKTKYAADFMLAGLVGFFISGLIFLAMSSI